MPPKKKNEDEVQEALTEVLNVTGMPMPSGVLEELLARQAAAGIGTKKNPAAVALGRLGGLKGGKARAEVLTAKQRRDIAAKGATKRWAEWSKLKTAGFTPEEIRIIQSQRRGQTAAEINSVFGISPAALSKLKKKADAASPQEVDTAG